jgi:hypothetical protein
LIKAWSRFGYSGFESHNLIARWDEELRIERRKDTSLRMRLDAQSQDEALEAGAAGLNRVVIRARRLSPSRCGPGERVLSALNRFARRHWSSLNLRRRGTAVKAATAGQHRQAPLSSTAAASARSFNRLFRNAVLIACFLICVTGQVWNILRMWVS